MQEIAKVRIFAGVDSLSDIGDDFAETGARRDLAITAKNTKTHDVEVCGRLRGLDEVGPREHAFAWAPRCPLRLSVNTTNK